MEDEISKVEAETEEPEEKAGTKIVEESEKEDLDEVDIMADVLTQSNSILTDDRGDKEKGKDPPPEDDSGVDELSERLRSPRKRQLNEELDIWGLP